MSMGKNILFIMFDQLRFDYLSCAGHPHLHTPHIDWLASQGLRFTNAYVQSPVCGASRMSFYTGRYVSSHGAAWNGVPLKVGEITLGDHLRDLGMDAVLVGKTHMKADAKGMARLGLSPDSIIGARVSECGFDLYARDDGLWGMGKDGAYDPRPSPYNEYLKSRGYDGANPWHDYANSSIDADGDIASGWLYANATLPANIREDDSETPWLTRQAIDFIESRGANESPYLCHLSYIKPHWPYIVPAPYHNMYSADDFIPVNRHPDELIDPNPIYEAFAHNVIGKSFHREDVRHHVLTAYMGLIKQIDDQMGVLFDHLKKTDRLKDTIIILTSDHGDYMGDHWLGEKDLFHEPSVKVPLIIYDPSSDADPARGQTCDALVEAIDLAASCIEWAGGHVPDEIIEGRSLRPFLYGDKPDQWREVVVSEYDYSTTPMADQLQVSAKDARLFMIADHRWTFIHAEGGLPPMLFDRLNDPNEWHDLGRDPAYHAQREWGYQHLQDWALRCAQRSTISDKALVARRQNSRGTGIIIGAHDQNDVSDEDMQFYRGKARQNHLKE